MMTVNDRDVDVGSAINVNRRTRRTACRRAITVSVNAGMLLRRAAVVRPAMSLLALDPFWPVTMPVAARRVFVDPVGKNGKSDPQNKANRQCREAYKTYLLHFHPQVLVQVGSRARSLVEWPDPSEIRSSPNR